MADLGSLAAPAGFLTALIAMLTYIGRQITSDRAEYRARITEEQARTKRAETAAEQAGQDAEAALRLKRAADLDLATAAAELEGAQARLRICKSERDWAYREIARLRAAVPGGSPDPTAQGGTSAS